MSNWQRRSDLTLGSQRRNHGSRCSRRWCFSRLTAVVPCNEIHIVWHGCNSTCRKWKMENGTPWQHTIRKGQLYKYQRVIRFQWLASWMNVKNMSVEPGCLYRNWKLKHREDTASKLSLIRPTSKSKCSIAVSSALFFWRLIIVSEEGPKAFVQE